MAGKRMKKCMDILPEAENQVAKLNCFAPESALVKQLGFLTLGSASVVDIVRTKI